ncbi:MAG: ATP-binding protein [Acidobacteriota bacterium]
MTASYDWRLSQRPSAILGWSACAAVAAVWAILRLVIFQTSIFPLTYVIPLLLCVWTRDKRMLWTMAVVFAVLQTLKQWWILPATALPTFADWTAYIATLLNLAIGGAIVHAIIVLRDGLEESLERITAQAQELEHQNEELAQQSQELTVQSEELSQQVEEISRQSEELSAQNEELEAQSEEIRTLNDELSQREALLAKLFDGMRFSGTEAAAIQHVCRATVEMLGPPASAAVVYENTGENLVGGGAAGIDEAASANQPASRGRHFIDLVIEEKRTASLNDATLRTDLALLEVPGHPPFLAALAAPLTIAGGVSGAIGIYSHEKHDWTVQQFRIVEWIAAQTAQILEIMRLQESRARHAALLDLTPDGIFVRKTDGTITDWGAGAQRLYGFTKEEALGARVQELLRTQSPTPRHQIEEDLASTGRWTGELIHVSKDGRELVVESRWLAKRDASGALQEVLESNVDITARKRAEEALARANVELAAADRRKNEFLATLSHELRNPLAPIRYALELLDRTDGSSSAKSRPREIIDRQLEHLVRLVDDLLDVTRVASNKIRLRREHVQLVDIVRHAVESVVAGIEQAGHVLTVSVPETPIWLHGDPVRLSQVVTNLLANATRYTPPGGRITISAAPIDDDVVISIADTGVGLGRDDVVRVFEMFAQVGEPGHGGLGIGLALVKGLVELHGGSVEARSDGPGLGSEFRVRLPRAAAPEQVAEMNEAKAETSQMRVLVVDDNLDSADMLKTFLEIQGHEVFVAYEGTSALATATRVRPAVALLDVGLPDISGYELAQRLRENPSTCDVYLVALTGWGQDDDRERARAAGFDRHLTKPAHPDMIREVLAEAFRLQT